MLRSLSPAASLADISNMTEPTDEVTSQQSSLMQHHLSVQSIIHRFYSVDEVFNRLVCQASIGRGSYAHTCGQIYVISAPGLTTNLLYHLQKDHAELLDGGLDFLSKSVERTLSRPAQQTTRRSESDGMRSIVWQYFDKRPEEKKAMCKVPIGRGVATRLCGVTYTLDSSGSTKNLLRHISRHHSFLLDVSAPQAFGCLEAVTPAEPEVVALDQSSSRRRGRGILKPSTVRKFFKDDAETGRLVCRAEMVLGHLERKCNISYANDPHGSTKNLLRHLQRAHSWLFPFEIVVDKLEEASNCSEDSQIISPQSQHLPVHTLSSATPETTLNPCPFASKLSTLMNDDLPSSRTNRISIAWKFFKKDLKMNRAFCTVNTNGQHCGVSYSMDSSSTKNLLRHLRVHHLLDLPADAQCRLAPKSKIALPLDGQGERNADQVNSRTLLAPQASSLVVKESEPVSFLFSNNIA